MALAAFFFAFVTVLAIVGVVALLAGFTETGRNVVDAMEARHLRTRPAGEDSGPERAERVRKAAEHYVRCLDARLPLRLDHSGDDAVYDVDEVEATILAGDLTRPQTSKVLYSLACDGLPRAYGYDE